MFLEIEMEEPRNPGKPGDGTRELQAIGKALKFLALTATIIVGLLVVIGADLVKMWWSLGIPF